MLLLAGQGVLWMKSVLDILHVCGTLLLNSTWSVCRLARSEDIWQP